tara:strand:+ start:87 stop:1148 length:1062 start_codon:yes stop_codon:yes gene_type:complete
MVRLRKKYYGNENLKKNNRPYKYQLDYVQNGKRIREVIKDILVHPTDEREIRKDKEKIAQTHRSKLEIELATRKSGMISRQLNNTNFVEFFEVQLERKNDSTKVVWENTLNHIKGYHGNRLKFEDLTSNWIEGFQSYLLERVSNNSALTYISKVNATLNVAVKQKIIFENPYKFITTLKNQEKEKVFLVKEEIQKIIDTEFYNEDVKNAFLFSCYTGLRISDIVRLTWDNINGSKIHITQKKTKELVYLPLNENALDILTKQDRSKEKVFNIGVRPKHINRMLRRLKRESSITKDFTFHSARHTFATILITSGVNIFTVSKLLGHKDIESTLVYAKVIDEEKELAVSRMPKFT